MRSLGQHVSRNLELYLMGFSVAMALVIPLAIEVGTNEQELAITALAACGFQGLVFWSLRRRYRQVRGEIIEELRAMLKDRINNHLTIVLMSISERWESPASERELLEAGDRSDGGSLPRSRGAVGGITTYLESTLSDGQPGNYSIIPARTSTAASRPHGR